MRCAKCGYELNDGEIYCRSCGHARQIVPDYNVLEDEILPDLLSETPKLRGTYELSRDASAKEKAQRKMHLRVAAAAAVAVVVIGGLYWGNSSNSKTVAEEAQAEEALSAETKAEGDVEAQELSQDATATVAEPAYRIKPLFSEKGGSFSEDISLTLSTSDDAVIYYTLDGTDPTSHNGAVFEAPIQIKSGVTTVKAACFSSEGRLGPVAEETYSVSYEIPDMPKVTPESGTYHEDTYVTITSDAPGATIYYTWDGSNPTRESMAYTQPVLIPEGNHVLAVIVIDSHGMASDILRCNFVYLP